MSFPQLSLLLATVGATTIAASAQNAPALPAASPGLTRVDSFGNLVRSPQRMTAVDTEITNGQSTAVTASDRSRRGRDRNDKYRTGQSYYVPALPYYPYPYPAPAYNNYYFPAQPTTTIISPPSFSWQKPATITSIPLGTYYGGYPAPVYPGYSSYPAPGYGYPAPAYGYPVYPGVPYPVYGSTHVYGNVPGTIYSQSQNSGYGFSLGNGGISVQLGNQRASSTTTVTRY